VRQSQFAAGVERLGNSVAALQTIGHEMFIVEFTSVLAEAFAASGRIRRGLKTIDEVLARIDRTGETLYLPEALRIKGEILASVDFHDPTTAEEAFRSSLDWARRQPAPSWELRSATSLANLWRRQGRDAEARALLSPVYACFDTRFATSDLRAAGNLLDRLA
jgi:predicted ATPase